MTYEGHLLVADPSPDDSPDRVYTVEFGTHRDTRRPSEAGSRIEFVLRPETAPAGRPAADVITISSFPDEAAIAETRYATDPVVWLTGRAAV